MGSDSGQDNETPLHRVWVDAFLLAARQVRNSDYSQFLQATKHAAPPFWQDSNLNQPEQPVVGVSWHDAVAYCEWLSRSSGLRFRLPTEAEWERAARGGVENELYPWGNDSPQSLPEYANRWKKGPEPVAQGAPTRFGLYDICENVHEWCADWYQPDYYAASPERNPPGPEARHPACLPRRLLAPSHQGKPLRRQVQHPPRISLRRLRLSHSPRPLTAVWVGHSCPTPLGLDLLCCWG